MMRKKDLHCLLNFKKKKSQDIVKTSRIVFQTHHLLPLSRCLKLNTFRWYLLKTPQSLPRPHSLYETQSLMMERSHILIVVLKSIGAYLGGAQLYLAALPDVNGAYCIGAFPTRARLLAFYHALLIKRRFWLTGLRGRALI